jgi:hypothetical protein
MHQELISYIKRKSHVSVVMNNWEFIPFDNRQCTLNCING